MDQKLLLFIKKLLYFYSFAGITNPRGLRGNALVWTSGSFGTGRNIDPVP